MPDRRRESRTRPPCSRGAPPVTNSVDVFGGPQQPGRQTRLRVARPTPTPLRTHRRVVPHPNGCPPLLTAHGPVPVRRPGGRRLRQRLRLHQRRPHQPNRPRRPLLDLPPSQIRRSMGMAESRNNRWRRTLICSCCWPVIVGIPRIQGLSVFAQFWSFWKFSRPDENVWSPQQEIWRHP